MEKALLDNMFKVTEQIGKIAEIVERHDEDTLPEIVGTLQRMESKQNADILRFNLEKEALNNRLLPLEADYISRKQKKDNTQKEVSRIKWAAIGTIAGGTMLYLQSKIVLIIKSILIYLVK